MAHNTQGLLGPGFTQEDSAAKHVLGTQVRGTDGTLWMYCLAAEAITQYMYVTIDENHSMSKGTKAGLDDGHRPGFAQIAFTNAYYGWVPLEGSNISVLLSASTAVDSDLFSGAVAGYLGAVSASQTQIEGVYNVAAVTTAAATSEIIAHNPHISGPGTLA
jgi:hypothetical protein